MSIFLNICIHSYFCFVFFAMLQGIYDFSLYYVDSRSATSEPYIYLRTSYLFSELIFKKSNCRSKYDNRTHM